MSLEDWQKFGWLNLFATSGRENESWFGVDRQTPEFLPELLRLFRLDSLSADSHQKSVCYFGCPVRRNNDSVTLPQAFEKLVGPIGRFVFKTPSQSHRGVHNEDGHQYL